ncbi:MAG: toll/interleukin-1 receptor domain-containing protein, partial [Bacteroidota bacterium]
MSERKVKVFISYASEDQTYARKLFEEFKRRNIDVWFDKESLLPGQKWEIEIRKAIRASRYFIAILSSKSLTKRGVVQKEIKEALDVLDEFPESEIFIIPIRIDSSEPSDEKLRKIQWVDMFPNWEEGLKKILNVIDIDKEQYPGHILSDAEEEIIVLLVEARSCADQNNSLRILHQAENLCKKIMEQNNPKGYDLMIETLSDLAKETELPSKRYKLWQDCLSVAFRGIDKFDDATFVDVLARKTVDFVQDPYINIPTAEANHLLAIVGKKIDYFLKKMPICEGFYLLSRKSSLIRNMTKFHATRITQERMSQEAFRCAERAVKEKPDSWDAHLELALSLFTRTGGQVLQYNDVKRKY